MEEKKNKISLSVFISVLAVLIIIIMAGFIYMQKINADREIAGLKNDSEELKATVTELQGKLDNISDIASTDSDEKQSKNNYSIDGTYESNTGYEMVSYTFSDGKVTFESLGSTSGTYEISGNKITIKYNKQNIDPDGETVNNDYLNGESEILTIENDKTIVDKNGTKFIKK